MILVNQILSLPAGEAEAFAHVAQRVALVVGHLIAIETQFGEPQHPPEFVNRSPRFR